MNLISYIIIIIISNVILIEKSECAKILCIASIPTYSHNVFFRPIWKALADRGHQLTVLTTDPMKKPYPNIQEVNLTHVYSRKAEVFKLTTSSTSWPQMLDIYYTLFENVAIAELGHPAVQNIIRNETEYFDLVIAEIHISVMIAFAHRFKCPLIGISSMDIITQHHSLLGNPTHPLLYHEISDQSTNDDFLGRIMSVYNRVYSMLKNAKQSAIYENIIETYFGPNYPTLEDIFKNISFVLVNVHPFFNIRPVAPKYVAIGGGAHIAAQKPLPKDLQVLLDNATQGVIYFSLGTNVKQEQYPPDFINTTVAAFRELPYQVVWRSVYNIPNIPPNVKVFEWLPQPDLLRHGNIKLFITQGGLHSKDESLEAGVPMIVIPFMSDQNTNARQVVENGVGKVLNKNKMTKEELKTTIEETIKNSSYKENILTITKLLKDQPMTGLEKAVWYVEYTIRTKPDPQLFSNTYRDIPWYQYLLLDVFGFLLTILVVAMYFTFLLLKFAFSMLKKKNKLIFRKKQD